MKTILIDVDGTIADIHTVWLDMYNKEYGDNMTVDQITKWEMHELVKPECGKGIYKFLSHPDFYKRTHPIDGAIWGVGELRRRGHKIVFVTSGVFPEKERWVEFLGFGGKRDIVFTEQKELVVGDIMIDDYQPNIKAWYEIGKHAILFDRPWNQTTPWHPRAKTWEDAVRLVGSSNGW